jgi:hypothetical protein
MILAQRREPLRQAVLAWKMEILRALRRNRRRGDRDRTDRRTRVDINVDRDRRGYRADRRTRVDVDVDRKRRSGGRDVDVGVGGIWV